MENLKTALQNLGEQVKQSLPESIFDGIEKSVEDLKQSQFKDGIIKLHDLLPEFALPNAKGEIVKLKDFIPQNKLIVSFYRGGWCPFCNLELNALQRNVSTFEEKGAKLIAISPESPDNSLSTIEKNNLSFQVLTDKNNEYAKKLGLVFQLSDDLKKQFSELGLDLKAYNDANEYSLPIPATFVVNEQGEIIYKFADVDFKNRADINEIIKVL